MSDSIKYGLKKKKQCKLFDLWRKERKYNEMKSTEINNVPRQVMDTTRDKPIK